MNGMGLEARGFLQPSRGAGKTLADDSRLVPLALPPTSARSRHAYLSFPAAGSFRRRIL